MNENDIKKWRRWAKNSLPRYDKAGQKQIVELIETMGGLVTEAAKQHAEMYMQGARKNEVDKQCAYDVATALRRHRYDAIPGIEQAAEKAKAAIDAQTREMDKRWNKTKDMQDKARQVFERLTGNRFYD